MKNCPRCSAFNADDSDFCIHCGEKLPSPSPQGNSEPPLFSGQEPGPKKSGSKGLLIGICIALVLAVFGGGAFMFLSSSQNKSKSDASKIYYTKIIASVYEKPEYSSKEVTTIPKDQGIIVTDLQINPNGTIWGEVSTGGWVCISDSNKEYLSTIQQKSVSTDASKEKTASSDSTKEKTSSSQSSSSSSSSVPQTESQSSTQYPDPSPDPTVNQYISSSSSEYIFPNSNTVLLTRSDLIGLPQRTLELARNEIYARHGRRFNTPYIQDYFNTKSWYRGTIAPEAFSNDVFNSVEIQNIDTIKNYESEMGYL